MYGQSVIKCLYDELPKCQRFQPECVDEGNVFCVPRVVSLGFIEAPDADMSGQVILPPPPPSTLTPIGP